MFPIVGFKGRTLPGGGGGGGGREGSIPPQV